MAKLLIETREDFNVVKTPTKSGKDYFIEGIMMQAEVVNRNRRMYPKAILERAVEKYNDEKVKYKRAFGTLGHEDTPRISEDKVSHIITELFWEGNDVIGKAKILDTYHGKEVKAWIDGGASFGVSSRALGSLKEVSGINQVQDDLELSCIDVVLDPSAPSAYVESVMEGVDWFLDTDGNWKRKDGKDRKSRNLQEAYFRELQSFVNSFKTTRP